MHITVITLCPQIFPGPLAEGLLGKALEKKIWALRTINLREFATDKHQSVDDEGFGGGAGMVLLPHVVDAALRDATCGLSNPRLVYLSPKGLVFNQNLAKAAATPLPAEDQAPNTPGQNPTYRPLVFLCGRFEGADQRVLDAWQMEEWSLGDFILMGGDVAALAMIESIVRLLPGVLGNPESLKEETFSDDLLEYPHYTRPRVWQDREVPPVLLSGHHQKIAAWRLEERIRLTKKKRPDLYTRWTASSHCDKKGKR